jgi:hypothetical protein
VREKRSFKAELLKGISMQLQARKTVDGATPLERIENLAVKKQFPPNAKKN